VLLGSLKGKDRHNTRNFLKQISADHVVVPTADGAMPNDMENAVNSGSYQLFFMYSRFLQSFPRFVA